MTTPEERQDPRARNSIAEVFLVFLRLGLTSFGGPVAHLGYFRNEFVARRNWLSERAYADLIALCQFLPGPASSQVGIAIGLSRAGYAGALAAWTGFTLPSALLLVAFALGLDTFAATAGTAWISGLKIAAVAVVAHAVLGMMTSLTPDRPRATLAVVCAVIALTIPTVWGQVGAILIGALAGTTVLRTEPSAQDDSILPITTSPTIGIIAITLFLALLVGLPLFAASSENQATALFDSFYRSGALVFGGGHVVLPLLQTEVVPTGWVNNEQFLAGYGAAQAVPGPLFTFAAYLGAVIDGWRGAAICLAAVFLPSFLLVFGALPFWDRLRREPIAQAALTGVNAAVVGLLLAALYDPVWTAGIKSSADFALAVAAFLALFMWRAPSWLVVIACAAIAGTLAW